MDVIRTCYCPIYDYPCVILLFLSLPSCLYSIIAVIPNLPFFFCVWRSWSHYKGTSHSPEHFRPFTDHTSAYRASQYLQSLLDSGIIVPEASPALDLIYKNYAPEPSSSEKGSSHSNITSNSDATANPDPGMPPPPARHTVLLTRDAVPVIISLFGLKPSALADLQRAVEQARVRVESGRTVL